MEYRFLEILPSDIKQKYIQDFIQNKGILSDGLWEIVIDYINRKYKSSEDYQTDLKKVFKEANHEERAFIKQEIEKNGNTLLDDLQDKLIDLEDVITLNQHLVRKALQGVDMQELAKALYIVSPAVKTYFQEIFTELDFTKMRGQIGNIPITEAERANRYVVEMIHTKY